jgi:CRISPR-associated endonuclease/helicase Cas3
MSPLTAGRFVEFFQAAHGENYEPFPWQRQLVTQVLETGRWPDLVDVPTGLGKTSMLDIAVFVLASSAGADHLDGGRRRIFFVVDRRLVVDEAFDHARRLVEAVTHAPATGILRDVADALRSLRGTDTDADPITVTRMRGGTTWASSWVDRPDQPTIVVGTIDQVGARLCFRGYGTRDQRKPMDAALMGTDSLILLDEAHLATVLLKTVQRAFELDGESLHSPRASIVSLTATPQETGERVMEFDVAAHQQDEVAWRRLTAAKRLVLAEAEPKKLATALADRLVSELAARGGARGMVVCNTVRTARQVHEAVRVKLPKSGLCVAVDADGVALTPELLIGRTRPVDRDHRLQGLLRRFGVGRPRDDDDASVDILVATQTVEVGANLDVDVLVTESAPFDALVQRIGRLNRLGDSELDPIAVVIHDGQDKDAIYGPVRAAAWAELSKLVSDGTHPEGLLASPLALRELSSAVDMQATSSQTPDAPILTTPILRAWAQTSPRPDVDPPVGPYLHGLDTDADVVTLLWRDDIFIEDADLGTSQKRLEALPYVATESVDVPFRAAIAWLTGAIEQKVADIDTYAEERPPIEETQPQPGPILRMQDDTWLQIKPSDVRPGDVIVLPSQRGGLDEFGWNPLSTSPVVDVRDVATLASRGGRPMLRLDQRVCGRVLDAPSPETMAALESAIDELQNVFAPNELRDMQTAAEVDVLAGRIVSALAAAARSDEVRPHYRELIARLTGPNVKIEVTQVDDGDQLILRAASRDRGDEAGDDDSMGSSVSSGQVRLDDHHASVGARTRAIGDALGLDPSLTELLVFAAEHHDLGKLDPRFQAALRDGDTFLAEVGEETLAKSGLDPRSPAARRARSRSGLPAGFRHEIWSAALAGQILQARGAPETDIELVTHLIATHHGYCRPYFEPVLDPAPRQLQYAVPGCTASAVTETAASADLSTVSRFDRLNRRYGYWGLALLETIVRCADQTCSREGE